MIGRILEPEVMDTEEEAREYDSMDHNQVNRIFVSDLLQFASNIQNPILDVGTGTAQIPIELCQHNLQCEILAIDAAEQMLLLAQRNIHRAQLQDRIHVQRVDAKSMPFADGAFPVVISNSIIHHIPEPKRVFAEMVRVCAPGGVLFVRDLLRPQNDDHLQHIVKTYAAGATASQRQLFSDSLRAALTLEDVQEIVTSLGFAPDTVKQTSDRHWTWASVAIR